MSKCDHGISLTKNCINIAAVIAPPYRVDPAFLISAMLLSISVLSYSSKGNSQSFSPASLDDLNKVSVSLLSFENKPAV